MSEAGAVLAWPLLCAYPWSLSRYLGSSTFEENLMILPATQNKMREAQPCEDVSQHQH